jgi:hypothetical protein
MDAVIAQIYRIGSEDFTDGYSVETRTGALTWRPSTPSLSSA